MSEAVISEKKARIREIATDLFRVKGYAATSMRDLAQEVGIEAASLYSHVKSKEELLQSICFNLASAFFETIRPVREMNASAAIKLQHAILAHVEVVISNTSASAVFLHEWRHLSEPAYSDFKALRSEYERIFLDILRQGSAEGAFSFKDESIAVRNLLSALNWLYEWYRPDGRYDAEEISNQLFDLIFNGIKS
jgi:AcrR family transcriptional regulator